MERIGIIVTWFGKLPTYFEAWLKSAEANSDIDFLFFTDCDFVNKASNINIYKMTFNEIVKLCSDKMKRPVSFDNSYKFCDARPFFGKIFEDYLFDYDFWGYCDIDLVFGHLRAFLTEENLKKYDRFFQYGHLSVFRNNEQMKNLYKLPGGIYTMDEIFIGTAKTTPEEHWGINRICQLNNIQWFTDAVFGDFSVKLQKRLELGHGVENYDKQIFIWENGHTYRYYEEKDIIKKDEFIYLHWQKKKPSINGNLNNCYAFIITPTKLIPVKKGTVIEDLDFDLLNPVISTDERKKYSKEYFKRKIKEFITSKNATKSMWIRQKIYNVKEGHKYP